MSQSFGRVLVYGGSGSLGTSCVTKFKSNNWWVACVTFTPNKDADANILVQRNDNSEEQEKTVLESLKTILGENKLDAIICAAGGWAAGNAAENLVTKSEVMWKNSVWTAVIAASAATRFLKKEGLLVMTGSSNALKPKSNLIGYSIAKVAVHHLTRCLGESGSGLPQGSICAAILAGTLDTASNRKANPGGDFSTWIPLECFTELYWKWANKKERPANGSVLNLVSKNFNVQITAV